LGTAYVILWMVAPEQFSRITDGPPRIHTHLPTAYLPNHIPLAKRVFHSVLAIALIAYGARGVWVDDIVMPGKRRSVHFHGAAAIVMFGALLAASAVLGSTVVDHYDRRDNERYYRAFAERGQIVACILFGLAIVLVIVVP
jgi:hypothetical protein